MADDGGAIIGRVLASRGVRHLFTLCGGHISPILVGAEAHGIHVVDVRDEVSAVFAADAVARMTGVAGVAAVTAGPGVTNTVTAVKNAQLAQSPLLIFGGAAATLLKGRGALQDSILIFAHYMLTHQSKHEFSIEDLNFCFDLLNIQRPRSLANTLGILKRDRGWLAKGSRRGTYVLTARGRERAEALTA